MTLVERTCALAVLAWPLATAGAQSAEAEVLFQGGRDLIQHGQLAAGCDKLVASERLERSVGTLLNLGDCREQLGKLASAWAAFLEAEVMARRSGGDDKRQAEAGRRAALLEPRLSYLEIKVAPAVEERNEGLIVRRDGDIVTAAQWNTALPLDPGTYTVAAEAPGYQAWHTTVPVGTGETRQAVVVPSLERTPVAPADARPPEPQPARVDPPAVATPHPPAHPATWTTTRMLSAGVALAGAATLGTGIAFGVHADALEVRGDRRCPWAVCADPQGLAQFAQAQTARTRANLLYVAGGAALVTAVVLWIAGASGETVVVPTAGDHHLGVAMTRRF